MTTSIAIAYHSGYGHTESIAKAIAEGAGAVNGATASLHRVDALTEADWDALDAADAIIFGSPTYMGNTSAAFQKFAEESSKKWGARSWADKLAGGFTVSGSYLGDKGSTLQSLFGLAAQHGMLWVSLGELPPTLEAGQSLPIDAINRLGSFTGLAAQANHKEGGDTAPGVGDIATAKGYGARIARLAQRFRP